MKGEIKDIGMLSLEEFRDLTLPEKLAYLDQQLALLAGDYWRLRPAAAPKRYVHPAPRTIQ